jgi:hypothetical protein
LARNGTLVLARNGTLVLAASLLSFASGFVAPASATDRKIPHSPTVRWLEPNKPLDVKWPGVRAWG